jgi:hypothetical protein
MRYRARSDDVTKTNGSGPRDLSPRMSALWVRIMEARDDRGRRREFSDDGLELIERGLRNFDLADELRATARAVGFDTPAGRGLLSGARDSANTALKCLLLPGLTKADVQATRRSGRKPDTEWSPQRRQRDHLTGQAL